MSTATLAPPLPHSPVTPAPVAFVPTFAPTSATPNRFRINCDLYHALFEAGWIGEKTELIDGEIIEKVSHTPQHTQTVRRTERIMRRIFGEEFVYSQSPLVLGTYDEPEPDVFVVTLPETAFAQKQPGVADCCLAVEVSVSTVAQDKNRKTSRYALAGVAEYWVIDVENRRLFVYRAPTNGAYPAPIELTDADTFSPLAAPNATIPVADLLP